MSDKKECVRVAVRCRPMSSNEVTSKYDNIVLVDQERGEIIVQNTKQQGQRQRQFSFDMVYGQKCKQTDIFQQAALPIIQSVLQGYNGTIFAYGQTGTGKTFTMQGNRQSFQDKGIIPRTFERVIHAIEGTVGKNFLVSVSMLQLYNQEIVDLLASDRKTKLQLHEDPNKGIYVQGLKYFEVKTVEQMNRKLQQGSLSRHVGSTQMNSVSSRSHSIFMIRVQQEQMIEGQSKIKAGKLNLVDLAGSQRQKKTQATGGRSKQGIHINSALLTLGQVIGALTSSNATHVPYRDSKLTRLLQQSLGGNAKTVMIANVGPASYNYEETISTLRYASQAKKIKNKPKVNQDPKDALIRQYQQEIQKLKKMLDGQISPDAVVVQKRVKKKANKQSVLPKRFQRQKQQLQKEKQRLKAQEQAEKQQLLSKAQLADQQRQQEKLKQQELAKKLKQMKEKFMHGTKLKQQARLNQKKLFEAQQQLQQRKQQQRRLQNDFEKIVEQQQAEQSNKLSLQEQVQHRRKQLAKLNNKLKLAYQQNNDIQEFMVQQRQQLQQENRSLVKEIKLLNLIIQHFVPIEEVALIQHRLQFDDEYDDWLIKEKNQYPKPNFGSSVGLRYPLCREARMAVAMGDQNPRFRQENILALDLNLIDSPTQDFQSYQISPNVLESLSVIINDNQEEQRLIAKQQRPNVYIEDPQKMNKQQVMRQRQNTARAKSAKKMRPASGRKKK